MKAVLRKKAKHIITGLLVVMSISMLSAQELRRVETLVVSNEGSAKNIQITEIKPIEAIDDSTEGKETKKKRIIIDLNNEESDNESFVQKAFMGIFTENLSLKKARELNYPNNYGVLITGVSSNTPAEKHGLAKNDILMRFDNTELIDKETFESVITRYKAGDKIKLTYFRDGKENVTDFEFGKRNSAKVNVGVNKFDFDIDDEGEISIKNKTGKQSVGFGGGTWMPIWVALNMDDVNGLVTRVGFSKVADDGMLFNGGGGKIGIGKGLFLGGMGAGYSLTKKANANVNSVNVIRRLQYHTSFGGVTLDKRFAITKNFIGSFGVMIGGAGQTIEISQSKGDYNWGTFDTQIQDSANNYVKFKKSYIIAQPKAELLYRLTSWLGIRAEGGYIASYGWSNGWEANLTGDTFEVTGSPNTKFDSYTVSVGPWFGF
ncbi:MAG TPA: PDZ domain-containing protein [Candidatus Cloacimonadota bacterium]|nr:PDZ domain-containing protein [Candidatus Cloacimonadota bacterium]